MSYLYILIGLGLLFLGGEILVRGATGLARRFGVSPLVIGAVIVGFGTSAPELITSVQAVLADAPGVAVGNVVGSNIANILLILGLAALMAPIAVRPAAFRRDGTALALAMLLAAGVLFLAPMNRLTGSGLMLALFVYIGLTYWLDRRTHDAGADLHEREADMVAPADKVWVAIAFTLGGLVALLIGANRLVFGAVDIATAIGVSEAVIGLTIVAVGTSLPELAASISAARKGEGDLAFGNIIGSNIFNGLGILGAAALTAPFEVPARLAGLDLLVMLGATGLLIVFATTGAKIDRREGAILLGLYAAYLVWLAVNPAG